MVGSRAGRLAAMVAALAVAHGPSAAAGGEWFVEVVGGSVVPRDATVIVEKTFPDPTYQVGRKADFDPSMVLGVRGGRWLDAAPWFGWAIEISRFRSDADSVRVVLTPLLTSLAFRRPIARSARFPNGRLQPGVQLGFGFTPYHMTVEYRPQGPSRYDIHDVGGMVVARAVLAWLAREDLAVLTEYGFTMTEIDRGYSFEGARATLRAQQGMVGLSFRW